MADEIITGLAALLGKKSAPKPPEPSAPSTGPVSMLDILKRAQPEATKPAPAIFGAAAKPIAVTPKTIPLPFNLKDVADKAAEPERKAIAERAAAAAPPASKEPDPRQLPFTYEIKEKSGFAGITKIAKPKKEEPKLKISTAGAKTLKDLFGLTEEPVFKKGTKLAEAHRKEGVKDSAELQRILKIRRRPPFALRKEEGTLVDLTETYRKASGTKTLFPIQSAALYDMRLSGGLFGPVGVGGGKTLITLLAPEAMDSKMAVILVPPALRAQLTTVDIPRYSKEWRIPLARIRIVAYSQLSTAASADILEEIKPDLIIADEAHSLRHREAARTKRFMRYMHAHPECRFVCLSGTMTRRSLRDYQHLAELALKKNSPLPNHFPTLCEWAEVLDVAVSEDDLMPPGALLQLCNDEELNRIAGARSDKREIQTVMREAFRRRVVETPGVVATEESSIGTSLVIQAARPAVPGEVKRMIDNVRDAWVIGDEELTDPLAVARVTRQLAAGFYYRPVWPDGKVDHEWLEARKNWNKEVREILRLSRRGMDSPMLIAQACARGEYQSDYWEAWAAVKDRPEPPREAVWISDFLARAAIAWAKENCSKTSPGIIWYSHSALGEMIAKLSGFPFFGPGAKASKELTEVNAQKTPAIIASVKAHGTGKNLQPFCLNLFTTPISSGADAEQAIARTHRPGQEADEVRCDVYVHTIETMAAFRSSVRDAAYIESTQGQRQKLNFAEKIGFGENAFEFGSATAAEIEAAGISWKGPIGPDGLAKLFSR